MRKCLGYFAYDNLGNANLFAYIHFLTSNCCVCNKKQLILLTLLIHNDLPPFFLSVWGKVVWMCSVRVIESRKSVQQKGKEKTLGKKNRKNDKTRYGKNRQT